MRPLLALVLLAACNQGVQADVDATTADVTSIAAELAALTALVEANGTASSTNAAAITSLQTETDNLRADVAALQSALTDAEAELAVLSDAGFVDDAWVTSQIASATSGLASEEWVSGNAPTMVTEDVTIDVSDAAGVLDALTMLNHQRVLPGATVTLAVADGTYDFEDTLDISHVDGQRLRIVGNETTPASVLFRFPEGVTGLRVDDGDALGWVDGITFDGDDSQPIAGVVAVRGATLRLGPNVVVQGFGGHGVLSARNSTVSAEGSTSQNNGRRGFFAFGGSHLRVEDVTATQNGEEGIRASLASGVEADGAVANNNGENGIEANTGGSMWADGAVANDNGDSGFKTWGNSVIWAPDGEANGNGQHGYAGHGLSMMSADDTEAVGNGRAG